jgi:hypothetical protein
MASVESPEDAERVLMLADEFDFPVIFATDADLSPIAPKLVQSATPVLFRFDKPEAPDWIQKETEESESGENTANESVAAEKKSKHSELVRPLPGKPKKGPYDPCWMLG